MIDKIIISIFLLFTVACQPRIDSRGNVTVKDHIQKFVVGKTTMDDVLKMCGTPSLQQNNLIWIYIGSRSEDISIHELVITNKCVVKLTFDNKKILRNIEDLSRKYQDVSMDEDFTPLITSKKASEQAASLVKKDKSNEK